MSKKLVNTSALFFSALIVNAEVTDYTSMDDNIFHTYLYDIVANMNWKNFYNLWDTYVKDRDNKMSYYQIEDCVKFFRILYSGFDMRDPENHHWQNRFLLTEENCLNLDYTAKRNFKTIYDLQSNKIFTEDDKSLLRAIIQRNEYQHNDDRIRDSFFLDAYVSTNEFYDELKQLSDDYKKNPKITENKNVLTIDTHKIASLYQYINSEDIINNEYSDGNFSKERRKYVLQLFNEILKSDYKDINFITGRFNFEVQLI